jgi:hypothetical protein
MSGNCRKRVEKLEQKLADLIRQEALVNCICLERLFVGLREKFESEMNTTCPVHGFRRLGMITIVRIVNTAGKDAGKIDEGYLGLKKLVEEYERRLAEVEQAEDEQEYGSQ